MGCFTSHQIRGYRHIRSMRGAVGRAVLRDWHRQCEGRWLTEAVKELNREREGFAAPCESRKDARASGVTAARSRAIGRAEEVAKRFSVAGRATRVRVNRPEVDARLSERDAEIAKVSRELAVELDERRQAEDDLRGSYAKLKTTLQATVYAMARTVEMRDPYTAGHQRRVADLACAIANKMGLSEERIMGIRLAGLIHDIGKISVPAEILNKPGRLNEWELALIKSHPQTAFDILRTIEFPWPIAQIVLQHHEAFDGSGYPEGLPAEEVLLEARILAVADVAEAMVSHRPYRPALKLDVALQELTENRGRRYDPCVVDACFIVLTQEGFELGPDVLALGKGAPAIA